MDASAVTRVAIDETAARRGHDYITLFVDIDKARVLFVTKGKDAATVAAFAEDLAEHGGDPDAIDEVCIDMSPAFIKGVAESLPEAAVTFDKLDFGASWNVKPHRTSARPYAAAAASDYLRFVRAPAKSDNRPAIGSGSRPPLSIALA